MAQNQIQLSTIQGLDKNSQLIQANINAALTAIQAPDGMPYAPSAPGNWKGNPPISMQAAFDRMAALLVTLNSGPIP